MQKFAVHTGRVCTICRLSHIEKKTNSCFDVNQCKMSKM